MVSRNKTILAIGRTHKTTHKTNIKIYYSTLNVFECIVMYLINMVKRRCAAQQSLVGHSLELFRNCNLLLHDTPCQQFVCNHRDKQLRAFLALLRRPARPFSVTIRTMSDYWECTQFLMEPTILDCPRVKMANNISHRVCHGVDWISFSIFLT